MDGNLQAVRGLGPGGEPAMAQWWETRFQVTSDSQPRLLTSAQGQRQPRPGKVSQDMRGVGGCVSEGARGLCSCCVTRINSLGLSFPPDAGLDWELRKGGWLELTGVS